MTRPTRIPLPTDDPPVRVEFRLAAGSDPAGRVVVPLVRLLVARWRRRKAAERAAEHQTTEATRVV